MKQTRADQNHPSDLDPPRAKFQSERTMANDARHRDRNGEIGGKQRYTLIRILRNAYGAQAEASIDGIARLREAAETSFANVVRLLLFFTDIGEFYPVDKAWERGLGGRPVPFSGVGIPEPLPVSDATGHDGDVDLCGMNH